MATCVHANEVNAPRADSLVHKDECCQCFVTPKTAGTNGLGVCLTCFTGGCAGPQPSAASVADAAVTASAGYATGHAARHFAVTKHHVYLFHKQTQDDSAAANSANTVTELAALASAEPPVVDTYTAHCFTCALDLSLDAAVNPKLAAAANAIKSATPASAPAPTTYVAPLIKTSHLTTYIDT